MMIETWNIPVVKLLWKIEVNKEVSVNLNELLKALFLLVVREFVDCFSSAQDGPLILRIQWR